MVAFYLPGGIAVYAFSILLALGAFTGLAWAVWQSSTPAPYLLRAGLWSLLTALVGARAFFVAVNWEYFRLHLFEAAQVSLGGLAWPGALTGGLIGLALYAALTGQRFGYLADHLSPLLATMTVSIWMGCWLDGCYYGAPSSSFWGVPARDEWGDVRTRWPLQLVGGLFTLFWFWLLDFKLSRFARQGRKALFAVFGLALQLFFFSFFRADATPVWRSLHLEAWAALGFAALATLFLLFSYLQDWRP